MNGEVKIMKKVICTNCGETKAVKVYKPNNTIEYVCDACEHVIITGEACGSCRGTGKQLNITAARLYFDAIRKPITSKKCVDCDGSGVIYNE